MGKRSAVQAAAWRLASATPVGALLATGVILSSLPAMAQSTQAEVTSFNIGAQPLGQALTQFGLQSGLQVSVSAILTAGRTSSGVQGTMPATDALRILLQGTDAGYRLSGDDAVIIVAAPGGGAGDGQLFASQDDELVGDDIIVEGELLDRGLQETLTSVTVVTGEELESRGDLSIREVVKRTPGVTTSSRNVGFVIRGVDERGVGGNADGTAANVSTIIDGTRITNYGRRGNTFLSTWDLDQIEILRGPQSTATGRNAIGGAVIIRSNDPTFDQEAKLRLGVGNYGTFQGSFAFNTPIIEDTLALRISGDVNKTDGFVDNVFLGTDDEGEQRNLTVRAGLLFEPNDDFSAVLKLSLIDHIDGFRGSDPAFFPSAAEDTNALTQDTAQYRNANLRMTYDLNDEFQIVSETNYSDRDYRFESDFDGMPIALAVGFDTNPGWFVEQDLRLRFENDWISAVVGGFFARTQNKGNREGIVPSTLFDPRLPFFVVAGSAPTESNAWNYAAFGEVEAEVIDGLRLTVGARYDTQTVTSWTESGFEAIPPTFSGLLPPPTFERTEVTVSAFLPNVGISYDLTEDITIGATYRRGFRPGGASFNFFQATQNDFDAEFVDSYELSFRSQWFDDRLTINANAFYNDWKDQQVQVFGPSGNSLDVFTENAGKSM
ncbi:MAG: TonB-dependent receptor, partial [Pseudomonadota bacterium]